MSNAGSSSKDMSLVNAWWVFVKERFAPIEHLLMVFFLVLGNASIACVLVGVPLGLQQLLISFLLAMMFFFRLRCFDEIKDYDVDLEVNPTRPLARGLLSIRQVKTMFLILTVLELAIAGLIGMPALFAHGVAVIYSYLMYKEFFIGKYLSPHLTTYAVTHTFVSILVGYSVIVQATGVSLLELDDSVLIFGIANWALFNLFEFARKTYAPEEERDNVDTYSSLFKPLGAGLLSLSQVAFALLVLWLVTDVNSVGVSLLTGVWGWLHGLCAGAVLVVTSLYAVRPTKRYAGLFRNTSGAYLILFFLLLSSQGLSY